MDKSPGSMQADSAHQRIRRKLETLVEERSAFGEAFDAYIKGTLTSSDCSTLVDLVLKEFVADAKVSRRNVVLLEVVADAVAQLANREASR